MRLLLPLLLAGCASVPPHDPPEVPRHLLLPSRSPAAYEAVSAELEALPPKAKQAIAHFSRSCMQDAADRDALTRALLAQSVVKADQYPGHHTHAH